MPANKRIRKHSVELESLELDEALFNRVRKDMLDHAGRHLPAQVWQAAGGNENTDASQFDAKSLIYPWLGFGKTKITPESMSWYYEFIRDIDGLNLAAAYFDSATEWKPEANELLIADLGTMIDLNLIAPYLMNQNRPLHVVEVGGGYGRLAEALFNVHEGPLKYVLIDAVPASLIFAYEYLKRALPHLRIGAFYCGDAYDLEKFDIYICPIWHFETVGTGQFDLGINVQSMQEMDQHHVDFYMTWFDRVLAKDGIAYLCNRRDHVFKGAWNYPAHWQCLMKICTPRSWVRDFPVEVFRKGQRNYVHENRVAWTLYQRSLKKADANTVSDATSLGYGVY